MNVGSPLWGTLSGAEVSLWDEHLDHLIELFAAEFSAPGGGEIDPVEICLQLDLLVALNGIYWLLDAVPLILQNVPELDAETDRFDARISDSELVRTQVHMLTIFMNFWETRDLGKFLLRSPRFPAPCLAAP